MEQLISDSLTTSQNVHKAIRVFQQRQSEQSSSRIITRVTNLQLALIKNEYVNVYREHSEFVEKYEEKLKKILKLEAQISEFSVRRLCSVNYSMNFFSVKTYFHRGN